MLMPAIRAMPLPLSLLVTGVLADDQHRAVAADDLALLAHGLDRRSDLHAPRSTFENLKRNSAASPGDGSRAQRPSKTSSPCRAQAVPLAGGPDRASSGSF